MTSLSMTASLATAAILAAQFLLLLGMGMAIIRMMRGPRAQDRVLALDALTIDGMLLLLTIGIRTGSILYIEAGLIIALLGFAATAAFAKFLLRGEVIE
jgi:multicomponent K+:H+ antiporter subunit F